MKSGFTLLLLLCSLCVNAQKYWIGSVDTDWNNGANWWPNEVPSSSDNVVINGSNNTPVLPGNISLGNLHMDWGSTINLDGKTVTVWMFSTTGATVIANGGTIDAVRTGAYQGTTFRGAFTLKINRDGTNNYLGAQYGANTYENDFMLVCHTGNWTTYGISNQVGDLFLGKTTIQNIGSGWLMVATNPSSNATFKNDVTFHNAHNYEGRIQVGVYGGKIQCEKRVFIKDETVSWGSYITITEGRFDNEVNIDAKVGVIGIGSQNTTRFKKNINITNRNGCIVEFGSHSGQVIFEKESSFTFSPTVPMTRGQLKFQRCTFEGDASTATTPLLLQVDNVPLSSSPTTYIILGDQITFQRPVKIRADYIYYKNCYFGYDVEMERTGSSNQLSGGYAGGFCHGGSTFMKKAAFINSYGDNWILQGQEPDIFKDDVSFFQQNHPWGVLRLSYAGNTIYEGNVTVTAPTGPNNGVSWGESGGTTQLTAGKTLAVNSTGYGWISISNFNQLGTSTNHTLSSFGSIYINNCNFASPITAESSRLFIANSTFYQPSFTKTGNGIDVSNGGNTFKRKVFIKNASSTGQIQFAEQNNTIVDP